MMSLNCKICELPVLHLWYMEYPDVEIAKAEKIKNELHLELHPEDADKLSDKDDLIQIAYFCSKAHLVTFLDETDEYRMYAVRAETSHDGTIQGAGKLEFSKEQ